MFFLSLFSIFVGFFFSEVFLNSDFFFFDSSIFVLNLNFSSNDLSIIPLFLKNLPLIFIFVGFFLVFFFNSFFSSNLYIYIIFDFFFYFYCFASFFNFFYNFLFKFFYLLLIMFLQKFWKKGFLIFLVLLVFIDLFLIF
jgi:hypothetical protein